MAEESSQVTALRHRYQSSLADKSRRLGELIDLLTGDGDVAALNAKAADDDLIEDYLHRLAGSSGMYGYDDIAILARAALANLRQGDGTRLAVKLVELRSLLDEYS